MTLARKIYLLMEVGKAYHIADLAALLYEAERQYVESDVSLDEAFNEEWLEAVQSANLRQKIRDALKVTRKFGYTVVNVAVTPPQDVRVKYTCHARSGFAKGIGFTRYKTLHYGEFKDYTYTRIK